MLAKLVFLKKTALYFVLVFSIVYVLIYLKANGKTDPYYLRFTSHRQGSLILGSSRAAQGLLPEIFNDNLISNPPIYNYSFSFPLSPFGDAYLKATKAKLDTNTTNGIFVISVSPWSLARKKMNSSDDPQFFRENSTALNRLQFYNTNPNLGYLWKYYPKSWWTIISGNTEEYIELHDDGWLEVTFTMDSTSWKRNIEKRIQYYKEKNQGKYEISTNRVLALKKTIKLLQNHGKVFLVRLPVSSQMYNIEFADFEDFDKLIATIATSNQVPYLNFINDSKDEITTDGNHLIKQYAIEYSNKITDSILGN